MKISAKSKRRIKARLVLAEEEVKERERRENACKQCDRDMRVQEMPVYVVKGILACKCVCGGFNEVEING